MATMTTTLNDDEIQRRDAFAGRLFQTYLEAFEASAIHIGERLGLYQVMSEARSVTPAELATRAGTNERYTREWLEQQAVAGILEVAAEGVDAGARRYRLPPGHADVLVNRDSESYLAPLTRFVGAFSRVLPAVIEAFRTGTGVSWEDFGPDAREGQADMNRGTLLGTLVNDWLPAVSDVHARLQAGQPARVADIGCGAGWSSIGIARAYPNVRVDGFDTDAATIDMARANADEAGVSDQVTFHLSDAGAAADGQYDLVAFFECVHDMARPVEALRTARRLVAEDGAVIVMDERVAETFTAPGDELERFFYSASLLCCLPAGKAEQPSAATGTVMRPDTLRRYATEAGFRAVEILPIEHPFFRLYRLQA